MLNSKEQTSGFESLIKNKSKSEDTPTKSGTGIAEQKSIEHVSGYRAFVQRQLEKRKQKQTINTEEKTPSPTKNKKTVTKIVSQNVSQNRAKTPIGRNAHSANAPIGNNEPFENKQRKQSNGANLPIGDIAPLTPHEALGVLSPIGDYALAGCFCFKSALLSFSNFCDDHIIIDNVSVLAFASNNKTPFYTSIFGQYEALDQKTSHGINVEQTSSTSSSNIDCLEANKVGISAISPIGENTPPTEETTSAKLPIGDFAHTTNKSKINEASAQSPIGKYAPHEINTNSSAEIPIGAFAPSEKNNKINSVNIGALSPIGNFTQVVLKSNYTRIPNTVFSLLENISKCDFHIYLYLFRLSYGFQSNKTNISLSQMTFVNKLGLNKRTVKQSLSNLIALGLIQETTSKYDRKSYLVFYPTKDGLSADTDFINYFCLDNNIFDFSLKSKEFTTYTIIYYFSFGFKNNCTKKLLTRELAQISNLHLRNFQDSIRNLISLNLIKRTSDDISSTGISYRVFLPHEISSDIDKTDYVKEHVDSSIGASALSALSTIGDFLFTVTFSPIGDFTSPPAKTGGISVSSNGANVPIGDSTHHKKENYKKTSSSDADDFLFFLKTNLSEKPFPLAKEKLENYLSESGIEICKKHLLRLKPRLIKAENPVGLWIDSLKNPTNYPEIDQKTETEFLQEQRKKELEQRRVAQIAEKQKQEIIERVNTAWNALDELKQNELIAQSEKYFREDMGMGDKLPPRVAIIERAKKIACNL